MGRVRGAVNARALSLARKAVDLCNCRRREAAAECLVEKQVELVSFAEDPVMVVATLRLDVALAGGVVERTLTTEPALLAAHVCKAGALFGVAEGELVSNGAGVASGVGAADPNRQASLSLYVALTYIPGGGLLRGFAMRSDPKGFSGGVSAPLTASARALRLSGLILAPTSRAGLLIFKTSVYSLEH